MRKIFFVAVSIMFLAATGLRADEALFKMVSISSSSVNADAGDDVVLADYYHFYVGGSALIHNGQTSSAKVIDGGIARITNKEGYFKISLPGEETLKAGDVIQFVGKGDDGENILLHTSGSDAAGGRSGATKVLHNTAYTLKAADVVVGANEFYINYGASMSAPNYIKNITISRPNDKAKFFSFENEEVRDFTAETKVDLGNGLQVNSDGASTYNGIKAVSGKPNALFLKGKNANRAAELTITAPCKVEVWAWAANATYYMSVNEGSYAAPTDENKFLALTEANVITKGEKSITGTGEKVLYITPTGGFYIAAIRVTDASSATGLESEELRVKSEKLIENGQLVIIKNGVRYNAQGLIVK